MDETPTRAGTISRHEFDHVMVDKIIRAVKSKEDRSPSIIRFVESGGSIVLELDFNPQGVPA